MVAVTATAALAAGAGDAPGASGSSQVPEATESSQVKPMFTGRPGTGTIDPSFGETKIAPTPKGKNPPVAEKPAGRK
jgi:hypothetical protein